MDDLIPIALLTGFLGARKATLLNHLLRDPALTDTAILINEFAEVVLDHLLVEPLRDEVVLLNAGCLCCTIRSDLVTSLRSLFPRRARGELPLFRRVIVENQVGSDRVHVQTLGGPNGDPHPFEPTPDDARKFINAQHVRAYFFENSNDPRLVEQIASGTGAQPGGTLYVEALSGPDGPAPTYSAMFRYNIDKLVAAMRVP